MRDFPADGIQTMSEVHHAAKMLQEGPVEFGPPVVRVGGKSFFIRELLQLKSQLYFIPERYFRTSEKGSLDVPPHPDGDLWSIGWSAIKTNVSKHLICLATV